VIAAIRRLLILRKLNASLKPKPEYRARRLAALPAERRARYLENIASIQAELG
jgi:hypothetical protein